MLFRSRALGDGWRVEQNLNRYLAPLAILRAYQALRDDGAQVGGEVRQQLRAPLFWEKVDHAFDGLIGSAGVQHAQSQVPGFGEGDGVFHRLRVADFTDQNHVGRLPQRVLRRVVPGMRVDARLAVGDQRFFRQVHIFHRVFHGDDMARRRAVALIDHRRQRGRFARARAADHQRQPARVHDHFFQNGRQPQLRKVRDFRRDAADHHADIALLHKHIDAKSRQALDRNREVAFHLLGELGALLLVHQRVRQHAGHRVGQLLRNERLHLDMGLHAGQIGRAHV